MNRLSSIFISYSHKDIKWKDRVLVHLRIPEHEGFCEIWDDTRIGAGEDWHQKIRDALDSASVAVLLVSAHFLTSQFVRSEEVPRLLQRRATDGVRVFPIVVEPCDYGAVGWLRQMEVRPKNGKALSVRRRPQVETELLVITKEIRALLGRTDLGPDANRGGKAPKGKILWIDDYPTNNERLISAYNNSGVSVDLALDHAQAIARLQSEKYDVVITDMGRASDKEAGLRLLRELREQPFSTPPPVIVFSGVGPGDHRHDEALALGALLVTHDPTILDLKVRQLIGLPE